jgi:hypothetical protein
MDVDEWGSTVSLVRADVTGITRAQRVHARIRQQHELPLRDQPVSMVITFFVPGP